MSGLKARYSGLKRSTTEVTQQIAALDSLTPPRLKLGTRFADHAKASPRELTRRVQHRGARKLGGDVDAQLAWL
jgi:hypothetical protein